MGAEAVLSHLADEGAGLAKLAEHGQHVGGSAAGIGLKEGAALGAQSALGHVHQQLAQGNHVKSFQYLCLLSFGFR